MEKIKEIAMTYVGTPHITGGSSKGKRGGIDCANLPIMIFNELGYNLEKGTYVTDTWFLQDDCKEMILPRLEKDCVRIERKDLRNGDIIAYKWGRAVAHLSVVIDIEKQWVIHSQADNGVEVVLMDAPCFIKKNGTSREHSYWRLKEC